MRSIHLIDVPDSRVHDDRLDGSRNVSNVCAKQAGSVGKGHLGTTNNCHRSLLVKSCAVQLSMGVAIGLAAFRIVEIAAGRGM